MRISLLMALLTLAACQPEMGPRGSVSGGISSGVQTLEGTWYTTLNDESIRINFTASTMRFMNSVSPTTRSIKFLSNNTYYDYYVSEYVEFSISGNSARVCYDIDCHDLRKTP
jgi:cbb3-type cytochrome oxidase subunit 1